jgi:uncharacterized membrane protein
MEELFKRCASFIALSVEGAAVAIVMIGAIEAFVKIVRSIFSRTTHKGIRKETWLRFAVWLLLGLEFELAADVIRTAISPTWNDIAQLGTIAVIRTFLNYFLEEDLDKYEQDDQSEPTPKVTPLKERSSA